MGKQVKMDKSSGKNNQQLAQPAKTSSASL